MLHFSRARRLFLRKKKSSRILFREYAIAFFIKRRKKVTDTTNLA